MRHFRTAFIAAIKMSRSAEHRPPIDTITSGQEMRRWYWLKDELSSEAKRLGLKGDGGKFTIVDRIAHYLDTGEKDWPEGDTKAKSLSKIDWRTEILTPETLITDSYKNSQNVRRFFKEHAGEGFKFNIEFMAWMKANVGSTLAEALVEYRAMKERERSPGFQAEIAPHNQFNQYTRDFLADNLDASMEDVRKCWALKTQLPSESGRHAYERNDMNLSQSLGTR